MRPVHNWKSISKYNQRRLSTSFSQFLGWPQDFLQSKTWYSFLKLCKHLTETPFRIVNEMEYLFEEKHFWKTSKNSKPTKNCSVFQGNCWVFLFLTKCTDIPLSDNKPPEIRLRLNPTITYWKLNQQIYLYWFEYSYRV